MNATENENENNSKMKTRNENEKKQFVKHVLLFWVVFVFSKESQVRRKELGPQTRVPESRANCDVVRVLLTKSPNPHCCFCGLPFPYFLISLLSLPIWKLCKILPTLDSAFWHMRTFHDVPWLQNASDAMLKKSTAPCVLLICGFCVSTNKSWPLEGNAGNANPCDCISSSREPHPGIRRPSLWSVQSWITFVPLCPLRFHVQMMQQLWRPLRHCFSDAGRWWRLARFA